jgi:hypothetical protein
MALSERAVPAVHNYESLSRTLLAQALGDWAAAGPESEVATSYVVNVVQLDACYWVKFCPVGEGPDGKPIPCHQICVSQAVVA